jgi:hypothetical protein
MKRARLRVSALVVTGLLAASCSGGSDPGAAQTPTPTPTAPSTVSTTPSPAPNAGRILSAIEDGEVLHGVIGWQVSPRFPKAKGEPVVLYFIDGRLAWRERHEPYRYHGDDQRFDTRRLSNGPHQLRVTATYPTGEVTVFEAAVTVRNSGPVPPESYLDLASSATIGGPSTQRVQGVPVAGLWLLTFPGQVLKLSPAHAEPLVAPVLRRADGALAVAAPGCPGLVLVPTAAPGSVRFTALGAATARCAGWVSVLAGASWTSLPG